MIIYKAILLAILVEACVEYVKLLVTNRFCYEIVSALCFGVGFCILCKFDLLSFLDITFTLPYVGIVITGIIVSRGANYVYDIIGKFSDVLKKEF